MSGKVQLSSQGLVARVTLSHPGKFNAMSRAMWRELKTVFDHLQQRTDLRCVIVSGEGGHFCAGGDIAEYPDFRFDEAALRAFHEQDVWGGLAAMLACDLPLLAQIEGNCMGAGVEIASCCDIRIAGQDARFGAPIARLGFPMAPREAQLVACEVGLCTARSMLLEAAVFSADEMMASGFLRAVLPGADVKLDAQVRAQRLTTLAPQAARLNKQTLRRLVTSTAPLADGFAAEAYAYADSAEHREGINAFLSKRLPVF
ncbi:enoyl-CoA hydratase/isomerase family protein [Hydrogenophaga sp.]|uniref:enoyl-CoA hydratase/isomerase family protein n=1 Tax=Hydrogenophaga sp. TaxID=1904254 RepID=UPI002731BBE3|nr:enoyl-CoA hydratase-related protein [Hydrogenophaga sp.]MDP2408329.1 enoyl-CoA hydratase-related protein [Hydrogenophaga sp.]MDP3884261.1 enoyl-CoA hydratase-related protein [Hydrogenophaga sp.]MDZ4172875.1 enoyl-CoA hydratase-related protein [Hydrogenophaga sp.]